MEFISIPMEVKYKFFVTMVKYSKLINLDKSYAIKYKKIIIFINKQVKILKFNNVLKEFFAIK